MSLRYTHVMGMLINQPLFAHPRAVMTLYNSLTGRFGTGAIEVGEFEHSELIDARQLHTERKPLDVQASRFEGEMVKTDDGHWRSVEPFMLTKDGVAVITATGEMVNRGAWVGSNSGLTSYEGLKFQMIRAGRHRRVNSIIMDIESPGGQATGTTELAGIVRAVAAEKPVYAVANGMAASAGYAFASGATRLFNSPSGVLGSIGAMMLHLDMSKALEQKGITPTLIYAGDSKVDGHPAIPLSEDAKGELQGVVNAFYDQFVETVAAGRGRKLSKKAARETNARIYIGQEAVKAGLADGVATFEEVMSEASARGRKLMASGPAKSRSMTKMPGILDNDNQPTAKTFTEAELNAAVASATEAGHKAGVTEGEKRGAETGANNERARIKAIVNHEGVKGKEALALNLALEAPSMSAESISSFLTQVPVPAPAQQGPGVNDLRGRSEQTGVNDVPSQSAHQNPTGNPGTTEQGVGSAWASHIPADRLKKTA